MAPILAKNKLIWAGFWRGNGGSNFVYLGAKACKYWGLERGKKSSKYEWRP